MELRQLRYFVAVAEEHHFGRAARRLQIATPTLSQQLRALERNLGVMLVDRSRPGTVTLTRGGAVLLRHARILITRADRARVEVLTADDQAVEQVLLRVAFGAEIVLSRQLRRLTDDASLGVIALTSSTSDALLAVREEIADVAVVWDGHGNRRGLRTVVLRDVAVHLVVPAAHPLAGSSTIPVSDLADETIVMFPRALSPYVWDTMHRHLLPDGESRPDQVTTELNNIGPVSVMRGVAAGKGVAPALVPLAEHARPDGVVLRPLDPPLTLPLELAWREPASEAVKRVVAFLRLECRPGVTLNA